MKLKTLQKTLLIIIAIMLVIIVPRYSFAAVEGPLERTGEVEPAPATTISPSQITGDSGIDIDTSFTDTITDFISKIGAFIAVGVMMIIGIKYMTGSLEEKATYKKSMLPYVIGCFLLFGASVLAPKIMELFSNLGENTEEIGNKVLGIIQVVGTLIAVGVLMLIGLKYIVGSVEERAAYKKTMIPYVVGAVLLFGAVNLTTAIYNMAISIDSDISSEQRNNGDPDYKSGRIMGQRDGQQYALNGDKAGYDKALNDAKQDYYECKNENPESVQTKKALGYYDGLQEGWNSFINGRL